MAVAVADQTYRLLCDELALRGNARRGRSGGLHGLLLSWGFDSGHCVCCPFPLEVVSELGVL